MFATPTISKLPEYGNAGPNNTPCAHPAPDILSDRTSAFHMMRYWTFCYPRSSHIFYCHETPRSCCSSRRIRLQPIQGSSSRALISNYNSSGLFTFPLPVSRALKSYRLKAHCMEISRRTVVQSWRRIDSVFRVWIPNHRSLRQRRHIDHPIRLLSWCVVYRFRFYFFREPLITPLPHTVLIRLLTILHMEY